MNFKSIILISISGLFSFGAYSQNTKNDKPVTPSTTQINEVAIPEDFDNTLDNLTHTWIIQRASNSGCQSNLDIPVNDSVCKFRLSKMPCIMEMPYNPVVKSYVELYTVQRRKQMEYMLGLSEYYFPIFEQSLSANNLPFELKYLTVIESALNTTALSRVGAMGLWQLMVGTGRLYGLEINSLVDERLSPVKATNAAVKYLKDLYGIYGDWHLVIAAYNCGPSHLNRAIRRAGGRKDYWAIYPYLPRETRGYVPVFIAANYCMNYYKEHNMCPAQVNMPVLTDTVMIHQRLHLEQIANVLNLPIEEVRILNAQYKKDIVPGDIKPYELCLPSKYTSLFMEHIHDIANYKADSLINTRRTEVEIPQAKPINFDNQGKVSFHKVRKGESINQIASRYGVSVASLKKWNHLKRNKIKKGQKLKIMH